MATRLTDGRWKATWLNPATRKRESFHSHISPEDAERQKRERIKVATPSRIGGGPAETLEDFAMKYWWPSTEVKAPNTQRRYADVWNRYIAPAFALRAPKTITSAECQEWANALLRKGMAVASLHLAKSVLVAILERCVRENAIPRNVASYIELPKIPRRKRTMTMQQLTTLLGRVDGTELAAPVFLAAVLGLRRGELCALKWANVDEKTGRVAIVEQRLVRQNLKGKGIAEGLPKTESSVRSFRLKRALIKMLMSVGNLDSGYVCTKPNGKPWNPEHLTGVWAKARGGLGFKDWRFHDLRHGAGGILALLGVDLLTIGAILGQKSVDTTQLYAAAQDASATKGLGKLAAALAKGRQT